MKDETAIALIKLSAFIGYVTGSALVLLALLSFIGAGLIYTLLGVPRALTTGLLLLFSFALFMLGVVQLAAAHGLWLRKNWARIVMAILVVIGLLNGALNVMVIQPLRIPSILLELILLISLLHPKVAKMCSSQL